MLVKEGSKIKMKSLKIEKLARKVLGESLKELAKLVLQVSKIVTFGPFDD